MQGRSNRTPKRSARKRVIADAYELLARRVDLSASPAAALSPLRAPSTPSSRRDARMRPGGTPVGTPEAARGALGRFGSPLPPHARTVITPSGPSASRRGTPVRAAATPPAALGRAAAKPTRGRGTLATGTGTPRRTPSGAASGRQRSRWREGEGQRSPPAALAGLAGAQAGGTSSRRRRRSPRTPGASSAAGARDEHQSKAALQEISAMIGVMDHIHMFGAQAGDEVAAFVEADTRREREAHARTATEMELEVQMSDRQWLMSASPADLARVPIGSRAAANATGTGAEAATTEAAAGAAAAAAARRELPVALGSGPAGTVVGTAGVRGGAHSSQAQNALSLLEVEATTTDGAAAAKRAGEGTDAGASRHQAAGAMSRGVNLEALLHVDTTLLLPPDGRGGSDADDVDESDGGAQSGGMTRGAVGNGLSQDHNVGDNGGLYAILRSAGPVSSASVRKQRTNEVGEPGSKAGVVAADAGARTQGVSACGADIDADADSGAGAGTRALAGTNAAVAAGGSGGTSDSDMVGGWEHDTASYSDVSEAGVDGHQQQERQVAALRPLPQRATEFDHRAFGIGPIAARLTAGIVSTARDRADREHVNVQDKVARLALSCEQVPLAMMKARRPLLNLECQSRVAHVVWRGLRRCYRNSTRTATERWLRATELHRAAEMCRAQVAVARRVRGAFARRRLPRRRHEVRKHRKATRHHNHVIRKRRAQSAILVQGIARGFVARRRAIRLRALHRAACMMQVVRRRAMVRKATRLAAQHRARQHQAAWLFQGLIRGALTRIRATRRKVADERTRIALERFQPHLAMRKHMALTGFAISLQRWLRWLPPLMVSRMKRYVMALRIQQSWRKKAARMELRRRREARLRLRVRMRAARRIQEAWHACEAFQQSTAGLVAEEERQLRDMRQLAERKKMYIASLRQRAGLARFQAAHATRMASVMRSISIQVGGHSTSCGKSLLKKADKREQQAQHVRGQLAEPVKHVYELGLGFRAAQPYLCIARSRQNRTALHIQCGWRSFVARCKIAERRKARDAALAAAEAEALSEKARAEAAAQAARMAEEGDMKVAMFRREMCAKHIQRRWRRRRAERRAARDKAAARWLLPTQAIVRGARARRHVRVLVWLGTRIRPFQALVRGVQGRGRTLLLMHLLRQLREKREQASEKIEHTIACCGDLLLLQHELRGFGRHGAHQYLSPLHTERVLEHGAAVGEVQAIFHHAASLMSSVHVDKNRAPVLGQSGWLKLCRTMPGVLNQGGKARGRKTIHKASGAREKKPETVGSADAPAHTKPESDAAQRQPAQLQPESDKPPAQVAQVQEVQSEQSSQPVQSSAAAPDQVQPTSTTSPKSALRISTTAEDLDGGAISPPRAVRFSPTVQFSDAKPFVDAELQTRKDSLDDAQPMRRRAMTMDPGKGGIGIDFAADIQRVKEARASLENSTNVADTVGQELAVTNVDPDAQAIINVGNADHGAATDEVHAFTDADVDALPDNAAAVADELPERDIADSAAEAQAALDRMQASQQKSAMSDEPGSQPKSRARAVTINMASTGAQSEASLHALVEAKEAHKIQKISHALSEDAGESAPSAPTAALPAVPPVLAAVATAAESPRSISSTSSPRNPKKKIRKRATWAHAQKGKKGNSIEQTDLELIFARCARATKTTLSFVEFVDALRATAEMLYPFVEKFNRSRGADAKLLKLIHENLLRSSLRKEALITAGIQPFVTEHAAHRKYTNKHGHALKHAASQEDGEDFRSQSMRAAGAKFAPVQGLVRGRQARRHIRMTLYLSGQEKGDALAASAARIIQRLARWYVARRLMVKVMMLNWKKYIDPETHCAYWFNPHTGTTTYEKPKLFAERDVEQPLTLPEEGREVAFMCQACDRKSVEAFSFFFHEAYCNTCYNRAHVRGKAKFAHEKGLVEHMIDKAAIEEPEWQHSCRADIRRCVECDYQLGTRHCLVCEDVFCDTCFPTRHTRGKMKGHKWTPVVEMCNVCNNFAAQVRSLPDAPGGSGDGQIYCRTCYANTFPHPNPATGLDRMSATQAAALGGAAAGAFADYEELKLETHSMRIWREEEEDRLERDRVKEEIRQAQLAFVERHRHRCATQVQRIMRGYFVRFLRQSEIERRRVWAHVRAADEATRRSIMYRFKDQFTLAPTLVSDSTQQKVLKRFIPCHRQHVDECVNNRWVNLEVGKHIDVGDKWELVDESKVTDLILTLKNRHKFAAMTAAQKEMYMSRDEHGTRVLNVMEQQYFLQLNGKGRREFFGADPQRRLDMLAAKGVPGAAEKATQLRLSSLRGVRGIIKRARAAKQRKAWRVATPPLLRRYSQAKVRPEGDERDDGVTRGRPTETGANESEDGKEQAEHDQHRKRKGKGKGKRKGKAKKAGGKGKAKKGSKAKGRRRRNVIIKNDVNFSTLREMMRNAARTGIALPGTVGLSTGEHLALTTHDLTGLLKHGDKVRIVTRQDRHGQVDFYIYKLRRAEFTAQFIPFDRRWRYDDDPELRIFRYPVPHAEVEIFSRAVRQLHGTCTYQVYLRCKIKLQSTLMRGAYGAAKLVDEDAAFGRFMRFAGRAFERWKESGKDKTLKLMRERDEHIRFTALFAVHRAYRVARKYAKQGYKLAKKKYNETEFAKRRARRRARTGPADDSDDD